jgi:hypothetical protein
MIVGGIGVLAAFVLEQPYGFRRTRIIERRDDIL